MSFNVSARKTPQNATKVKTSIRFSDWIDGFSRIIIIFYLYLLGAIFITYLLAEEFICAECAGPINRLTAFKGLHFMKNLIRWNHNTLEFLCTFGGFLNVGWCFSSGKLDTCKTVQKPEATSATSGTNTVIGALAYLVIPYESTIQFRAIPSPSWALLFGDYRQPIESPMGVIAFNSTENALKFTTYNHILRNMVWYLTTSIPLAAEFIYLATFVECAGLINRSMAVKRLEAESMPLVWSGRTMSTKRRRTTDKQSWVCAEVRVNIARSVQYTADKCVCPKYLVFPDSEGTNGIGTSRGSTC